MKQIIINSNKSNNEFDTLNLSEIEKVLVQKALDKNEGNISKAAKELGMSEVPVIDLKPQSLPMDEASRMARAKEMGFDTDNPVYHGTMKDFPEFSKDKIIKSAVLL